ncbi:murein hydrolase activator EnvC family protein [Patescibacteria group bacterium]
MKNFLKITCVLLLAIGVCKFSASPLFSANRINELKEQINNKGEEISGIEADIEKYQKEIDKTLEEEKTLKNQIYQIQTTTNKLNSEITLTSKKIDNTNYNIEKLGLEIENKNINIGNKKESLAEIIRNLDEEESQSLLEILLAHNSLSDFFGNLERMEYLQEDINSGLGELRTYKNQLTTSQEEEEREKNNLTALKTQLGDQKSISETNKRAKNNLLAETKNKEENYKKILSEKLAKKEAFEQELLALESELQIEIDPHSLPSVGSGVLAWPLETVKITQYFGNTPFATKNPQVYNGGGHTGIDFRASVGTPLKSASSGIVKGIGNTDDTKGCYSYGKWILIEHKNGLSTLYAHLSLIKVSVGQNVSREQIVGYSGNTGYATGPHLHFTVYATQGVKITKFTNSINCKNAYIPIADKKAYLNPLSYL